MKKYIDCDGVILDTERGLFDEYHKLKEKNPELRKRIYLQHLDWVLWLKKAKIINDSINILKSYNPEGVEILTRVHSLNEARAKVDYFRRLRVRNNIVIVPDSVRKVDIVNPLFNVLVDDGIENLDEWSMYRGIPIYFGDRESDYPKMQDLNEVLNPSNFTKLLEKRDKH